MKWNGFGDIFGSPGPKPAPSKENPDFGGTLPSDLCECDHTYTLHRLDAGNLICIYREERFTNDGMDKLIVRCDCRRYKWNETNVKRSSADPFAGPAKRGPAAWLCRCGAAWLEGRVTCDACGYKAKETELQRMLKVIGPGIRPLEPEPRNDQETEFDWSLQVQEKKLREAMEKVPVGVQLLELETLRQAMKNNMTQRPAGPKPEFPPNAGQDLPARLTPAQAPPGRRLVTPEE